RARAELEAAVNRILDREQEMLTAVRSRPVLAEPQTLITAHESELATIRRRSLQATNGLVLQDQNEIHHLRSQARSSRLCAPSNAGTPWCRPMRARPSGMPPMWLPETQSMCAWLRAASMPR